jgi:hypothetical protein
LGEAYVLLLFGEFMVLLPCEEESLFFMKKIFGRPVIVCAAPQNSSLVPCLLFFLLIARHIPLKREMHRSKMHTIRAMKEIPP